VGGGLINPTKIENTFATVKHSKISYSTIKSYLDILQDVFLLENISSLYLKSQLRNIMMEMELSL